MEERNNPLEGFDWVFRPEGEESPVPPPDLGAQKWRFPDYTPPPIAPEALPEIGALHEEAVFVRSVAQHRRTRRLGVKIGLGFAAAAIGASVAVLEPRSAQSYEATSRPTTSASASVHPTASNRPVLRKQSASPSATPVPYKITNYTIHPTYRSTWKPSDPEVSASMPTATTTPRFSQSPQPSETPTLNPSPSSKPTLPTSSPSKPKPPLPSPSAPMKTPGAPSTSASKSTESKPEAAPSPSNRVDPPKSSKP